MSSVLRQHATGEVIPPGLISRCSLRKDILNVIDFKLFVPSLAFLMCFSQ